jgi:hypothetical protein
MLELLDAEDRSVDLDVVAVLELVGADDRSALLLSDSDRLAAGIGREKVEWPPCDHQDPEVPLVARSVTGREHDNGGVRETDPEVSVTLGHALCLLDVGRREQLEPIRPANDLARAARRTAVRAALLRGSRWGWPGADALAAADGGSGQRRGEHAVTHGAIICP